MQILVCLIIIIRIWAYLQHYIKIKNAFKKANIMRCKKCGGAIFCTEEPELTVSLLHFFCDTLQKRILYSFIPAN